MPDFSYIVVDGKGKEKKGNIEARTQEEATQKLRSDGYMVVEIGVANVLNKDIQISFGSSVKPRDLSVFCRQFLSMITAGVTILDSLEMLAEQTENKTMARAIRVVHADIQKGETLSDALTKHPNVFPPIMVSMVAAGEASGKIEVAFDRMSTHFEKSAKMKAVVKKAAMYPIMVCIVAIAVVVVMLVKVIPSYQDMFEEMGTGLPKITQFVVAASHFLMKDWFVIVAIVLVLVVGFNLYKQTTSGKILFGNLSRRMPIFGDLVVKQQASNFARTLSTLIYSGLPMIEALMITANTMTNYIYKQALIKARDEVAKGVPLSEPVKSSGLFPPMVGHMAYIGEETGDLEGMLNRLAEYYDEEVEMATQTVISALEPVIILVLAGVVGVIVGAIMAPMLAMYQNMDNL